MWGKQHHVVMCNLLPFFKLLQGCQNFGMQGCCINYLRNNSMHVVRQSSAEPKHASMYIGELAGNLGDKAASTFRPISQCSISTDEPNSICLTAAAFAAPDTCLSCQEHAVEEHAYIKCSSAHIQIMPVVDCHSHVHESSYVYGSCKTSLTHNIVSSWCAAYHGALCSTAPGHFRKQYACRQLPDA